MEHTVVWSLSLTQVCLQDNSYTFDTLIDVNYGSKKGCSSYDPSFWPKIGPIIKDLSFQHSTSRFRWGQSAQGSSAVQDGRAKGGAVESWAARGQDAPNWLGSDGKMDENRSSVGPVMGFWEIMRATLSKTIFHPYEMLKAFQHVDFQRS